MSGLVRGNRRKAVFAFKGLFSEGCLSRVRFRTAGFLSRISEVRGKSKLAERTPIFPNKTAGRNSSKPGLGRQTSVFHRTFGIARRKYAANSGILEHNGFFA